jgi:hypothetical protein
VLHAPPGVRLGLSAGHGARDAGCGHELRHKFNEVWSLGSAPTREIIATTVPDAAGPCPDEMADIPQPQGVADHGLISTLARSAALSASLLAGIGSSFVAAYLLHHALDKVVEDLELAVEGFNKLFIGLNPHDNLSYFPAQKSPV